MPNRDLARPWSMDCRKLLPTLRGTTLRYVREGRPALRYVIVDGPEPTTVSWHTSR